MHVIFKELPNRFLVARQRQAIKSVEDEQQTIKKIYTYFRWFTGRNIEITTGGTDISREQVPSLILAAVMGGAITAIETRDTNTVRHVMPSILHLRKYLQKEIRNLLNKARDHKIQELLYRLVLGKCFYVSSSKSEATYLIFVPPTEEFPALQHRLRILPEVQLPVNGGPSAELREDGWFWEDRPLCLTLDCSPFATASLLLNAPKQNAVHATITLQEDSPINIGKKKPTDEWLKAPSSMPTIHHCLKRSGSLVNSLLNMAVEKIMEWEKEEIHENWSKGFPHHIQRLRGRLCTTLPEGNTSLYEATIKLPVIIADKTVHKEDKHPYFLTCRMFGMRTLHTPVDSLSHCFRTLLAYLLECKLHSTVGNEEEVLKKAFLHESLDFLLSIKESSSYDYDIDLIHAYLECGGIPSVEEAIYEKTLDHLQTPQTIRVTYLEECIQQELDRKVNRNEIALYVEGRYMLLIRKLRGVVRSSYKLDREAMGLWRLFDRLNHTQKKKMLMPLLKAQPVPLLQTLTTKESDNKDELLQSILLFLQGLDTIIQDMSEADPDDVMLQLLAGSLEVSTMGLRKG